MHNDDSLNEYTQVPTENQESAISLEVIEPEDSSYDIFKKISSLSLPMALSYTFSFEVFLTTVMLAYLNSDDENEIAATTLIATMMNTLILLSLSPLFGISIAGSKKIGELREAENNDEEEVLLSEMKNYISVFNRNGLLITTFVTPPIAASLFFSKSILTNIFYQNEISAQYSQDFLRIYSLAVPGLMTRMCFEQIMFSFGRPKAAMILGLVSLAVGTTISAVLGFGAIGFEKMKFRGVAIGYVTEAYLTALLYGLYIARNKHFEDFKFFNFMSQVKDSCSQLKNVLAIGGPITFSVANELAMSLSMGLFAGLVGTREQAALSSAMQCVFFSFILLAAFGQANSQEVSREIGAKHYKNASRTGKIGLLTSIGYISLIPLACSIEPRLLTLGIKSNEEETLSILKILMPIISIGVIADIIRYNVLQQLRALGDSTYATIISVIGLSLGLIASGTLGLKTNLGIYGVGVGYTGGIVLASAGLLARWSSRIQPNNIKEFNDAAIKPISLAKNSASFFSATTPRVKAYLEESKETSQENDLKEGLLRSSC
jgi:MATE family multidrug resistance protein